jgi:AcrR family transcriptional regulator
MKKNDLTDFAKRCFTDALLQCIQTKKLADVTVLELCQATGYSRTTFYRYYRSPEDVLDDEVSKITRNFYEKTGFRFNFAEPISSTEKMFVHLSENRGIALALSKADAFFLIKKQFDDNFTRFAVDDEDLLRRAFLSAGLFRVYEEWVKKGFDQTPEEIAHILFGPNSPFGKKNH